MDVCYRLSFKQKNSFSVCSISNWTAVLIVECRLHFLLLVANAFVSTGDRFQGERSETILLSYLCQQARLLFVASPDTSTLMSGSVGDYDQNRRQPNLHTLQYHGLLGRGLWWHIGWYVRGTLIRNRGMSIVDNCLFDSPLFSITHSLAWL